MAEIEFSKDDKQIRLVVRTENLDKLIEFQERIVKRFNIVQYHLQSRHVFVFVLERKREIILKKDQIISVIEMDLKKCGL